MTDSDRKRQKREMVVIGIIIAVVALLTFLENRIIPFGAEFPISNTILMFTLININLLLLILLLFLVFRNLVKLLYDRKRKVMGAKLRTRLVVAFISLTLLPTIILFFFSINFISGSIEFWFSVPIEQALDNSLNVGRQLYAYMEDRHHFFLEKTASQIRAKKLTEPNKSKELLSYLQTVRREFDMYAVEVYSSAGKQLAAAAVSEKNIPPPLIPADILKERRSDIRSLFENTKAGELIRTVSVIPFGATPIDAEAYLSVCTLIPSDLSEKLSFISKGVEEYQQIKLLKQPIRMSYYLTISIVALLVLFCAIWFGFHLAKSISIPIKELAEGTLRVAEGDLSVSIDVVADDEIGSLVESFNKMTHDLRLGREQLEMSARILREQNIEIEDRRRYTETVLKNVSTGVISTDSGGFITTVNTSAEKMFNIRAENILHRNYKRLLTDQYSELAQRVMESLGSSRAVELPLRLTIDGRPRSFMANVNALTDDTGHHLGIVLAFDDLTDQEKAQRMAAWREVARRIAHEVKNPLTPISLSAQRLQRKYSARINDPVFDECTRMIIGHVELIRNLVNEFSTFARFPTANPEQCDLLPIISDTVAFFRESHENVCFELNLPETLILLNLDRQQIRQSLINLIDNAIAAMREKGTIFITVVHDPILKIVRLEVSDDGPGISDEDKIRLFEPYFSTKKTGMGLGLTIVSTIIADHHGMIRVQDNRPKGAKFIIELPE
jgi:two-component system nitrogen regulation sensor histidine kinase NtrY